MSDDPIECIAKHRLVPVVKIEDAARATALADALVEGGLPVAEITFRTDAAPEAIRAAAGRGDLLVGAGTVLSAEQARQAADCGARFVVSPGFNPETVEWCLKNIMPVTPGVATPTDIEQALRFGLKTLKFFPAEAFGGLKTLKALAAPYGAVRFIPTGGINAKNLSTYLEFPKVLACGGSWMVKADLIDAGAFDEIARLTAEAVALVRGVG